MSDNNFLKNGLIMLNPNKFYGYLKLITHSGEKENDDVNLDEMRDTMLDFFIMSKARKIYSISPYNWGSGFSEWCSKVYDIPCVKGYFEIKDVLLDDDYKKRKSEETLDKMEDEVMKKYLVQRESFNFVNSFHTAETLKIDISKVQTERLKEREELINKSVVAGKNIGRRDGSLHLGVDNNYKRSISQSRKILVNNLKFGI